MPQRCERKASKTEGIEDLLRRYPGVRAKVDSGCQGLARDFPGQVTGPPGKPAGETGQGTPHPVRWPAGRISAKPGRRSGSVSNTPSPNPSSRGLQRYIGRRGHFEETFRAIAGLVSGRCALR
jgi:hypothetical protein